MITITKRVPFEFPEGVNAVPIFLTRDEVGRITYEPDDGVSVDSGIELGSQLEFNGHGIPGDGGVTFFMAFQKGLSVEDATLAVEDKQRVAISGIPSAGKTTVADSLSHWYYSDGEEEEIWPGATLHTDDLIGKYEWSELSLEVSRRMDDPGPWLMEGVAVVRAVRKWMANHPGEKPPLDVFVWLSIDHGELTKKQVGMAKGQWTIYSGIREQLIYHGVAVVEQFEYLRDGHLPVQIDLSGPKS